MARTRLTAAERHEQVVSAAVTAFSRGGYAGTTTDQVARLAGVSQPYVIRIFRTKQELFVAAVHRCGERIEQTFRRAAEREASLAGLSRAYDELLAEREPITLLLHGITAGADDAVGEAVRGCFGRIYQTVAELTGASPEELRDFFARGMLLACLGAMRVIGPGAVPPAPWMRSMLSAFERP